MSDAEAQLASQAKLTADKENGKGDECHAKPPPGATSSAGTYFDFSPLSLMS